MDWETRQAIFDRAQKRLGYELAAAMHYNQPQDVDMDDVESIALELTGENDEANWHWIVRLAGGRWGYITGGCDYTGWDCQSSCHSSEHATMEAALTDVPADERAAFIEMLASGETERRALR